MTEVGDSDKKITAAPSGHHREREHGGSRLRGDAQWQRLPNPCRQKTRPSLSDSGYAASREQAMADFKAWWSA
jgi:hypothetical protein